MAASTPTRQIRNKASTQRFTDIGARPEAVDYRGGPSQVSQRVEPPPNADGPRRTGKSPSAEAECAHGEEHVRGN